jgi:hypothetical protein
MDRGLGWVAMEDSPAAADGGSHELLSSLDDTEEKQRKERGGKRDGSSAPPRRRPETGELHLQRPRAGKWTSGGCDGATPPPVARPTSPLLLVHALGGGAGCPPGRRSSRGWGTARANSQAARPPRPAKLLLCMSAWRRGGGAVRRGRWVGAAERHVVGPAEDEGSRLLPWIWC